MATMHTEELLDVFKNMTVLELNQFLKAFEEEFDVTAAAPVAVAAGPVAAGGGERRGCGRGAGRVRRRARRGGRRQDPGHQGGPVAHEPRAQGGQGPRRKPPKPVIEKASKEDAEKAKAQLEGAGATVELK